jgi:MFS transporter, YNFM family, putative membrane transport protein
MFALSLFMGQSVGVLLAAGLIERLGSATVIVLGGAVMAALGLVFSLAISRRSDLVRRGNAVAF